MKLSKIEITNFRCFESLALDLKPDINIIVGINGAGKTSILDAIATALYDVVAANGGGGKRQRGWQKVTLQPSDIHMPAGTGDPAVRRRDYVQFQAQAKGFYEVPGFPAQTPAGEPMSIEWTDHIKFQPPDGFSYDTSQSEKVSSIYAYFNELWQQLKQTGEQALVPFPVPAYYRDTRSIAGMPALGDIFSLTLERKGAFEGALDAAANYQAMFQWFYLRENRELREKMQIRNDPDFEYGDLKAARSALGQVIENMQRVYFSDQPPSLRAVVAPPGVEPTEMEFAQLSAGYRNLLALVLDFARRLAQAHPNWENPLEAPGILLIDEVELHLHPKWQQTIITDLRTAFPNTQIIVATHSPEVLTTVHRDNIFLLGSDHAIEPLPADMGTFGAESSRVLQEVFAAHSRPPQVESVGNLREYLGLVEAQEQDSERGRELRAMLEADLGTGDPDLIHADARISQLRVLRGQ
jgi:predicted ATP-binding protein involved in virulence